MAFPTVINKFGKLTGWADISVELLGRTLVGITSVKYDEDVAIDAEHGAGKMPVGYSEGNYNASASITFYKDELIALQKSLPPGTRIQDIPAFPLPIVYLYNGATYTDVLQNVKFKNNGVDATQGEGKIEITIDIFITHIDWNV